MFFNYFADADLDQAHTVRSALDFVAIVAAVGQPAHRLSIHN